MVRIYNKLSKYSTVIDTVNPMTIPLSNTLSGFNYSIDDIKTLLLGTLISENEGSIIKVKSNINVSYYPLLQSLIKNKILSSFFFPKICNDLPPLISFVTEVNLSDSFSLFCGGFDFEDANVAISKAIGEALERYASFKKNIPLSSEKNIKLYQYNQINTSLTYNQLPHYSQFQYNKNKKLVSSEKGLREHTWIKVKNLSKKKIDYLPFRILYWGEMANENNILQDYTTNGCGGGFNEKESFISALYELIERDHFLLYWMSGVPPQKINIDNLENLNLKNKINEAEDTYKLQVYFLDTSYEIDIFSCVCVIVDPILQNIALGGAAGNVEEALHSAFVEALVVISNISQKRQPQNQTIQKIFENDSFTDKKINRDKRMTLYNSKEGIDSVSFFIANKNKITIPELKKKNFQSKTSEEKYKHSVEVFSNLSKEKGPSYNLYEYFFQNPILKEFHYSVARAFVPSFLKLHLSENLALTDSLRLKEFAELHGKKINSAMDLNQLPHFFP